jgi:hypothetical protein
MQTWRIAGSILLGCHGAHPELLRTNEYAPDLRQPENLA